MSAILPSGCRSTGWPPRETSPANQPQRSCSLPQASRSGCPTASGLTRPACTANRSTSSRWRCSIWTARRQSSFLRLIGPPGAGKSQIARAIAHHHWTGRARPKRDRPARRAVSSAHGQPPARSSPPCRHGPCRRSGLEEKGSQTSCAPKPPESTPISEDRSRGGDHDRTVSVQLSGLSAGFATVRRVANAGDGRRRHADRAGLVSGRPLSTGSVRRRALGRDGQTPPDRCLRRIRCWPTNSPQSTGGPGPLGGSGPRRVRRRPQRRRFSDENAAVVARAIVRWFATRARTCPATAPEGRRLHPCTCMLVLALMGLERLLNLSIGRDFRAVDGDADRFPWGVGIGSGRRDPFDFSP